MESNEKTNNIEKSEDIILPDCGSIDENKLKILDKFIIQNSFDSFPEFTEYFTVNSQHSRCSLSWNKLSISCSCHDCQLGSNSCSCVKCFLEGPHKNHKCHIHLSSLGNCDCGDTTSWKQSGMCQNHRPPKSYGYEYDKNDDDYFITNIVPTPNTPLSQELKTRLNLVFQEVRKDIEKMIQNENYRYFEVCCQWFFKFCRLGDDISNLITEKINDVDFIKNIISNASKLDKSKAYAFFLLSGALSNNCDFSANFLLAAIDTIPDLLQQMIELSRMPLRTNSDTPIIGISTVIQFNYQYISNNPVGALTKKNQFDWIHFILKINDIFVNFILSEVDSTTFFNFNYGFRILNCYKFILRVVFHIDSEKLKMKKFFIEFCKSIEKIEGFTPDLATFSQNYDIYNYITLLCKFPHQMMKNMPYFVPEVVDIFIWHLFNDNFRALRQQLKGYSLSTFLHQLFMSNMLIFIRKNKNESQTINDDELFHVLYDGDDPKDVFNRYCLLNLNRKGENVDNLNEKLNEIYLNAIELPMASIASHYLAHLDDLPFKATIGMTRNISRWHGSVYYEVYALPKLISFVQMMFSFTEKDQKDRMIQQMAEAFCAFQPDSNLSYEKRKIRIFAFIMFVSILILDRDCINDDTVSICLKNLMTNMKVGNVDLDRMSKLVTPLNLSNEKLKEKIDAMKIDTDWNLILPCFPDINHLCTELIPDIIGNSEDLLLPFPEFAEPNRSNDNEYCPNLLLTNLKEVFECKFLFASLFVTIFEYNTDQVIIQYALNLFILFAQNSKEFNKNDDALSIVIKARTIHDLVQEIQTNNFKLFANMKINYKGNAPISLIQLIDNLGVIGMSALRQVGLSITTVNKSKEKLQKVKQTIVKRYQKRREKFASSVDRQSHECCSICHRSISPFSSSSYEAQILYIPVIIFKSISTEFYDDFANKKFDIDDKMKYKNRCYMRKLFRYNYVHEQCFKNAHHSHEQTFLMPKLDHLPLNFSMKDDFPPLELEIISKINNFLSDTKLGGNAPLLLSQMIFVLDFRSRLDLQILEDSSVISLYANLFRNAIFSVGFYNLLSFSLNEIEEIISELLKILSDDKNRETEEFNEVKEKVGNISLNQFLFASIVRKYTNSVKRLDEYLRQCYLIEKFYLWDKTDIGDGFIDWDFCLNFNYLYEHFYYQKVEGEPMQELPVYHGIDLPEYFLQLFYKPFNVPFINVDEKYQICIFSGEVFEKDSKYKGDVLPFTVVLNLYGRSISSISLRKSSYDEDKMIGKSMYVDQNGFEDPGFKRGSNLVLSRDRYYRIIDAFMSGDILDRDFTL